MNQDMATALQEIIDKEAIRDLVLCYSRGVDRGDMELLRDLYTDDATDSHGTDYEGSADGFVAFVTRGLPNMKYAGHHACNHMIGVDGDVGYGEVYAIAYHIVPAADGSGNLEQDFMAVRYIDNYRRCADGKWRFSKRVVTYDLRGRQPFTGSGSMGQGANDPSYEVLTTRFFERGPRAVPAGSIRESIAAD